MKESVIWEIKITSNSSVHQIISQLSVISYLSIYSLLNNRLYVSFCIYLFSIIMFVIFSLIYFDRKIKFTLFLVMFNHHNYISPNIFNEITKSFKLILYIWICSQFIFIAVMFFFFSYSSNSTYVILFMIIFIFIFLFFRNSKLINPKSLFYTN